MPTSETSRLSSANSESQKGSSRLAANWQLLLSLARRVNERLQQVRAFLVIRGQHAKQVTNGNHAAKIAPPVHRQEVVDAMLVHQTQAILERHIKPHGNQIARHDFADFHPRRTLVFRGNFIGNVACDTTPINRPFASSTPAERTCRSRKY